jgi:FixJ family two-component response regulator
MPAIACREINERQPQPTVYVVADDEKTRESLSSLVQPLGVQVETFPTAASFLDAYQSHGPDCLVVDVVIAVMTELELQQELLRRGDEIRVIILTDQWTVNLAVNARERGTIELLPKAIDHSALLRRIQGALAVDAHRRGAFPEGMGRLTPREREVLRLVVDGLSSLEIALRLRVSHRTVETHRAAIMKTMQAHTVAELQWMLIRAPTDLNRGRTEDRSD